MAERHERYGTAHFHFVDDAMTANRGRMLEMCERLKEKALKVTWSMMTRVDFVDEETLAAISSVGCNRIDFGIESGHPETLKRIHKPHTIEMVRQIIPMTASFGIEPVVFFILGFPWDTPESLEETRRLMEDLSPHVTFHTALGAVLVPFPATEIYEKYKTEYGLGEWWLGEDRTYDAPDPLRHAYFENQLFPKGAALDANFFRYSPEVRKKICDVFAFMWQHSLRKRSPAARIRARVLFETSRRMDGFSQGLERAVFGQLRRLGHIARRALGG